MTFKRGMLHVALAVLLLAAQHVALTHQLRHGPDHPARLAQQNTNKDKQAAHQALCDFHVSFAQLLGAVNCADPVLRIAANAVESDVQDVSGALRAQAIIPASRGPPALL